MDPSHNIISAWFILINSKFEPVGRSFLLQISTDKIVGHLPKMVKEALPQFLRNADVFDILIFKLKNPVDVPLPPPPLTSKAGALTHLKLIHGMRSQPLWDLLEKIKSSNMEDHIEELDGVSKIKDCFENIKDEKIQAFAIVLVCHPLLFL
jgi:hypothetical protein